jgi:hypothetical protein
MSQENGSTKKTPDTKALQKAVSDNKNGHILPSIADLYSKDHLPTIHETSLFQVLVNQNPKNEWIRQHPMTRGEYLPIERVEWLLTQIFIEWKVEIKSVQVVANSVVVTIRLYVFDQMKKEWKWQDGVGASPIQTDKGAGAMDWNAVKSDAVMKAAPAAESFAVKDAAEKFGKLFGRDLNRKETFSYDNLKDKYKAAVTEEETTI